MGVKGIGDERYTFPYQGIGFRINLHLGGIGDHLYAHNDIHKNSL